jgi:hypothetical protein
MAHLRASVKSAVPMEALDSRPHWRETPAGSPRVPEKEARANTGECRRKQRAAAAAAPPVYPTVFPLKSSAASPSWWASGARRSLLATRSEPPQLTHWKPGATAASLFKWQVGLFAVIRLTGSNFTLAPHECGHYKVRQTKIDEARLDLAHSTAGRCGCPRRRYLRTANTPASAATPISNS